MNSEQLTSFNLHLAKQCRRLSKPSSNFHFKKSTSNYSSKSTSSTSSNLNSDELDDLDLDDDIENSDSISSENTIYDSKYYDKKLNSRKGILNDDSNLFSSKFDSRKRLNKNTFKRTAANLRERKRMESINSAFDNLRCNLPAQPYEKRLSKVDTLKLAISYISFLYELLSTGRNPAENAIIKRNQAKLRKTVIQYHRNKDGVPLAKHILSWNFEDNPFQNGSLVLAKTWMPENPNSLKNKVSTDKINNSIKNNSLTDANSSTNSSTISRCSSFESNGSDESILQSNFIDSSIVDNSSNNMLKNSSPINTPINTNTNLPMNCFPNQSESTYSSNANLNEANNLIIDNSSSLFVLSNGETTFDNQNSKSDLVHNSNNMNFINNVLTNSSNQTYSTFLPDQMQPKPIYTNSPEIVYTGHNGCIQQLGNAPPDYLNHHFKNSNQLDASNFNQSNHSHNHLQINNHPQFISNRLLY